MSKITSVAVSLSKKDGKDKEKKHEQQMEEVKKRQKDIERRVGALERQMEVIRRNQG